MKTIGISILEFLFIPALCFGAADKPGLPPLNKAFLWLVIIASGIVLLLGIFIRHLIKRRRFYRRNVAGLQTFRSYTRSVLIPLIEGIVNLVALILIAGGGIIFVGSIVMLFGQH